ncbi:MAG TPA: TetR/AcrR family transcriptional regulator [Terriglobales bacterium]|nr:TetR/AcrR family transcriptional regulator [Terriglobales bacterium]
MPRPPNPEVEDRILAAARKLWHKSGEAALTMRAVAKAARTNTPAVYRRFRSREDLLLTLVESYQLELFQVLQPCRSLREFGQCYFDFALREPREYELMMSGLLARVRKRRPNIDLLLRRCAEWLGGAPADYEDLAMALYSLGHGTVMLVLTRNSPPEDAARMRNIFVRSLDVLVANAAKIRG